MAIEFQCPACSKTLKVSDQFAGKTAACPNCKAEVNIPMASPAAAVDPPPAPTEEALPQFMKGGKPKPTEAPQINPFASSSNSTESTISSSSYTRPGRLVLRRVNVLSVGKLLGALYAMFGLIGGAFMALLSIFGAASASQPSALAAGLGGGLVMIVVGPLLYGGLGFLGGVISGALYNVAAKFVGGVEFEV